MLWEMGITAPRAPDPSTESESRVQPKDPSNNHLDVSLPICEQQDDGITQPITQPLLLGHTEVMPAGKESRQRE